MNQAIQDLPWLPHATHMVFERPPLVLTLCQVRFAPILSIADATFVAPFQRQIQKEYPMGGQEFGVEIEFKPDEGEIKQRAGPSTRWRFTDQDDNWAVILTQDFLAIETRAYHDFGDFLGRFRQVLEALIEHISPTIVRRLGLRYVNEIRPRGLKWPKAIRKELQGPLATEGIRRIASHSLQQILLQVPKGPAISIRHGLLQIGATVKPRAGVVPSTEPFYLLDFDVFQEVTKQADLIMDADIMCDRLEAYNHIIYRLFRWAVNDEYVSKLGVRE